jgi:phage shock protein PspC (stress-responsive transcriptional regulator)
MKKNFSVNIGGRIFNIDDDAFECLSGYLSRLRSYFAGVADSEEIIADIEMRIAELLEKQLQNGQLIITLKHIEEVIAGMGEPDQMADTGAPASGMDSAQRTRGKLFRDPENRQIGGVAAGIAAWFGIDPVWIRLIFVLLTLSYAMGILVYGVLWLILPVAQSTSERLEMQRRTININTLRDELSSAGSGIQRTGNTLLRTIGTLIRFVTEIVVRVFQVLFKLLGRVAGLVMLLSVVAAFIGISTLFLIREPLNMGDYQLNTTTVLHGLQWLVPGSDVRWLAYITVMLFISALSGLLIYTGLRLLLKWPPLRWQVVLVFVVLLLAGIVTGAGTAFQYSRSSEKQASITKRESILFKKGKLHIASGPYEYSQYFLPLNGDTLGSRGAFALGEIRLSLRPVPADSLFVTCVKSASAWQQDQAESFASGISYSYKAQDTLLTLNPRFFLPESDGMRYQKMNVIVGIPLNTEVVIDENLRWLAEYSDFTEGNREGEEFVMTSGGLKAKTPPPAVADSVSTPN